MTLIEQIIARAKSNKQRIVLPESFEERTITAADKALADDIADIILIGNREKVLAYAAELGLKNIDKATIIDPALSGSTLHADTVVACINDRVYNEATLTVAEVYGIAILRIPWTTNSDSVKDNILTLKRMNMETRRILYSYAL